MQREGWTPGPWELCYLGDHSDFDGNSRVVIGDGIRLAVVHTDGRPEAEANARLIASAPDLAEALDQLLDLYVSLAVSGDAGSWDAEKEAEVKDARAALAKARGESA